MKKWEMEDEVCRLCLADTTSYDAYTSYDTRIHLLMPEIDLNITPTFILCEDCSDTLNNAYTFKQKCLQVEERIKNYISETQTLLINLRWVRDQNHSDRDKSVGESEEQYHYLKNASITDSNVEDYENVNSINEKHHLTFPKIEIFEQCESEYASKDCKEEIEDEVESESFNLFECEICMASFNGPIELERHRIIHSKTAISQLNYNYSEIDPLALPNQEISKCHIAEYATNLCVQEDNKSVEVYTCEICKESFKEYTEFDQHRIVHVKREIFPCNLCNKKFYHQTYLTRHKMTHSDETIRYFCDICNKGFRWRQSFACHKDFHKKKMHTCSICSKSYRNLRAHMRTAHIRKHVCKICDTRFGTKLTLLRHMRVHSGDSLHKCEVCGKGFRKKDSLSAHMRSHQEGKPFKCNTCQKGYMSKVALEKHMIVHIPNSEKPFVCEILTCSKRFKTANSLTNHMCRHDVKKTHRCNICHKGFAAPSHLKYHMRIHTGERPYQCDTCHKGFSRNNVLQRHLKVHRSETN